MDIILLRNVVVLISAYYSLGSPQSVLAIRFSAYLYFSDCWFIQLGRYLFFNL